jgi:predicted membrane channel-forming protein YqfA (hemolysin III family)
MRKLSVNKVLITATTIIALFFSTRLEFDGFRVKTAVCPILWIGIGILGFRYFKILRGGASAIRKSLLALGFAFYIFGTLFYGSRFFMCAEGNHGILFINKRDKSLSLECRTYDCYGTADDCQLYKVKNLTRHIKWVTKFNENQVDTSEWQR